MAPRLPYPPPPPVPETQHHHERLHDPSPPKMKAPPHPVAELQGPFEESMAEAAGWEETEVPSDAASRRTMLLDAPTYERVIAGRWKQKLGEKYHPLWKLVAQLSFGIHLLAENLAKSDDDVMQILQNHVDDIDLFLERTTEDLTLAEEDIQERLRCLQLPLQHPKVFDRMLEDKAFRNSIVEGNEKIEHIVARTGCAMKDSLKDAQKGLDSTTALERYMSGLGDTWVRQTDDHEAVFMAMLENVEGWRQAFVNLLTRSDDLNALLKKLSEVINQMQQRAGEVSRRLIRAQQKQGHLSAESSGITYIQHQNVARSDGRRSATPEQRKPLPGPPNRPSARESGSNRPRESSSSRPPTHQSHRPDTAQSSRSASSYRSQEGLRSSGRNSSQLNTNTKGPRMVEIKRSPRGDVLQVEPSIREETHEFYEPQKPRRNEPPIQAARAVHQATSASNLNGSRTGLGITQADVPRRTGDAHRNGAHHLVGPANGPPQIKKLPLTPSSESSSKGNGPAPIHELDSQSTTPQIPVPMPLFAQENGGSPLHSPPTTPSWAKQTFELEGRDRIVPDKTAFRSHPPNAQLGSPPVNLPNKVFKPAHRDRANPSVGSSLGAPGPEVATSDGSGSTKSTSVNGAGVAGHSLTFEGRAASGPTPQGQVPTKSFAVELEGSTPDLGDIPLMFGPEVFSSQAVELEAPLVSSQATAISDRLHSENGTRASAGGKQEGAIDQEAGSSTASASELSAVETQMRAAVRRSFIARYVELPGVSFGHPTSNLARVSDPNTTGKPKEGHVSLIEMKDSPANPVSTPEISTPDLPSTEASRNSATPQHEHLNQRYIASAQRSPAMRKPVQLTISPVASGSTSADPGSAHPKTAKSLRSSIGSNASSQSQWRAFFKGQLSPAEFSASSPTLATNKELSGQKLVLEGRRGQMASPTLGWQWNPMTPDAEDIRRLTSTQ